MDDDKLAQLASDLEDAINEGSETMGKIFDHLSDMVMGELEAQVDAYFNAEDGEEESDEEADDEDAGNIETSPREG